MAEYDVAILGLGPVGCTAALLLAEAGLTVAAFERDKEVYKLPRAVNLDGEIIRAFQQINRGQIVQDLMQVKRPDDGAGFANSQREWLFGQDSRAFGRNGWQPANMFDQPEFEAYLRGEVTGHQLVDAFIEHEVTRIDGLSTAKKDGVAVAYTRLGSEVSQTVSARYAIACDGAASATRKANNIGWHDLGYDRDWLVVDLQVHDGHTLGPKTLQVCDPDRICTYVCTKDPYRRFEFRLHPGETESQMLDEETIHRLIDPWTPRDSYSIRRAAVYQFHAATADRWRIGRVFLAGDAAHQSPPFLGQGMNAGMRDVVNLAWKLPMVLRGLAKEQLLDSYFAERNAHAHDLVEWAVAIGRLMEHLADKERCARAGLEPPATPAALKSSGYGQGREQPPLRDGIVVLEQVSDTGSTGYLFNQPIVRKANGQELRLDELLGNGFALVLKNEPGKNEPAQPQPSLAAQEILQKINAKVVYLTGLEAIKGRFDSLFEEHDAALVRPDRLVFGHTSNNLDLDALVHLLAQKLELTDQQLG